MAKLLIIDDDPDFVGSISELLTSLIKGVEVQTAFSGEEGLWMALADPPDTILLDLSMPVMDGFEVSRRLKSHDTTKLIPIIMLTGLGTDTVTKVKALELGADVFLGKPCDPGELTAQIGVMLRIKESEERQRLENLRLKSLNDQLEHEIQQRKDVEEALRRHREELEIMVNERTSELQLIQEINNAVNIGMPLEDILNMTVWEVRRRFNFAVADIYTYDSSLNELTLAAHSLDSASIKWIEKLTGLKTRGMKFPVEKGGIFEHIIKSKQSIVTDEISRGFREFTNNKALKVLAPQITSIVGLKYVMRAPLISGGKVIGIIGAARKTEIFEEDRTFLNYFATQISNAIWRAQVEDALKREYAFRKAIENSVLSGITALDMAGKTIFVNPAFCNMVGYEKDELLGLKSPFPYWPSEEQFYLQEVLNAFAHGSEMLENQELKFKHKSGRLIDVILNASHLRDDEGNVIGLLASVHDITERNHLQKQVLAASEEERQIIGRDLHDGVGQYLTGTAFMAKALEDKLKKKSIAEASEASLIVTHLNEAIDKVRRIASGVSPVQINSQRCCVLFKEIADYATDVLGKKCELHCDEEITVPDKVVLGQLYMIAREALTNAAKHSGSDMIIIRLGSDGDVVRLEVEDNGKGFGYKSMDEVSRGMGMSIMRYRAGMIGASLKFEAVAGGGVRVVCTLNRGRVLYG